MLYSDRLLFRPAAGADLLKIFPADSLGLPYLGALKSVLPAGTGLVPTGGVDSGNLADYLDAGIAGVGLGSALFRSERPREALEAAARHFASIATVCQAGSHLY
ncbi:hypothetical protein [Marinobacterium aestuariivivens]|uniref:2-dehydro-3-deoxy-6-phosphogalactonate aldolase n=1 Tax=Marinobacterium aestuariivivens TaxID=1698799 RepID=A0ABW2A9I8_9GAMM